MRLGAVVGCQVNFVATDEISALAGFRVLQRGTQFDGCNTGIPRAGGVLRVNLRFFPEPYSRRDDSNERKKTDRQQNDRQIDHHTTGNRHTGLKTWSVATNLTETRPKPSPLR